MAVAQKSNPSNRSGPKAAEICKHLQSFVELKQLTLYAWDSLLVLKYWQMQIFKAEIAAGRLFTVTAGEYYWMPTHYISFMQESRNRRICQFGHRLLDCNAHILRSCAETRWTISRAAVCRAVMGKKNSSVHHISFQTGRVYFFFLAVWTRWTQIYASSKFMQLDSSAQFD